MSSALHESVLLVTPVAFHQQELQTILLDAKIQVRVPQHHGPLIDVNRVRYTCICTSAARGEDVEQLFEHGEADRRCETDFLAQP